MTAWGNVGLAVEAMRRGARDFIQKPWENERLLAILRTQVELHRALQRTQQLEAEARLLRAEGRPEFIAAAPSMQPVLQTIARIGPSDANVLITGEHGTGKEVVAQTLHALSPRSGVDAGRGQYRRSAGRHLRERALRPREGRVHRRAHRPHWALRTGRQRHHLPRRDRQRSHAPAGEAAARAGDRRDRARGLVAHEAHRCARDLGHQFQSAGSHCRRKFPRRLALPPEHGGDSDSAAARSPRRHSGACRATSSSAMLRAIALPSPALRRPLYRR